MRYFHLHFILSIQGFVPYTDCFTVVIVSLGRLAHIQMWYSCNWVVLRLVVIENNETCNAPTCLKPSGLIDWINCRFCSGWVQIKCATLSRTFYIDAWVKFHCSRLKKPVLPLPSAENVSIIHLFAILLNFTRFSFGGGGSWVALGALIQFLRSYV